MPLHTGWKRFAPLLMFVVLIAFLGGPVVSSAPVAATYPDTTFDRQLDFTRALASVAIAPNGRLYVASWRESKIYSWASATAAANGTADLTFGTAMDPENPPAGAGCGAASPTTFCGPEGLAIDANGNLYVAATYHNQVLIFLNPDTDPSPTTADQTITGMKGPRGVALDSTGRLYVADEFNYRVARYDTPLNGANAPDLVIGGTQGGGINQFSLPLGVALDSADNLYVTDLFNARVMRFDAPLQPGMNASQIYTGFTQPHDLAFDNDGNLFVSDVNNNNTPASRIAVIATPVTNQAVSTSFPNIDYPLGMDFDAAGNLYVALCVGPYPCSGVGKLLVYNAPTPPPPGTIALSVDAAADQRPISPLIYGVHGDGLTATNLPALGSALRLPLQRWGGNLTSRYNWQNDLANHGLDAFFENIPEDNPDPQQGNAADHFISNGKQNGADTIVSIPTIGWVAKNRLAGQITYDCSFDVRKYGPQQYTDPYDFRGVNCGNGIKPDGVTPITNNDRLDSNIQVDANFMRQWVQHIVNRFGTAANGGVRFYGLDNEPGLWPETHRDVVTGYISYQAFLDTSIPYAAMIKSVDPSAKILGPVQDGWARYIFSSYLDRFAGQATADYANYGMPFVAWYLQQMRAYEQANGTRLIDYFDLHMYPQAAGVSLETAGNSATQELRLRSTRSLWDPTYVDESWIAETENPPVALRLIPRMREWVEQHYPGTKLAISEYNWGGLEHINGALTQADVLGIFGREGLDLAVLFDPPQPGQPGAFAFRIYRNYDGNGSTFGETSVRATSADQNKVSIYAARRSSDDALTLLVINKTTTSQAALVSLAGFTPTGPAQVYRYSPADLTQITRPADQVASNGTFTATIPAQSITLYTFPADLPSLGPRAFLPLVNR